MTKHRMELRAWCLDCGTSQPFGGGVTHLAISADCKVCEGKPEVPPGLVLVQCDVCHRHIVIPRGYRSGVRCNRLQVESNSLCSGVFRYPVARADMKPPERRSAGKAANETKATPLTPVASSTLTPIPSLPCVACGTGVPPQRLCDPCDTKRQTARDRIWFAGVAVQELLRQDASIHQPQQTKAEIATEAYQMAELMLAKAKRT